MKFYSVQLHEVSSMLLSVGKQLIKEATKWTKNNGLEALMDVVLTQYLPPHKWYCKLFPEIQLSLLDSTNSIFGKAQQISCVFENLIIMG